ncbi:MAG: hypothetical protein JXQ75_07400 [Phycisphaerae bacterium]|nr:hypothetical protein [Phycisphaerae bacterium]
MMDTSRVFWGAWVSWVWSCILCAALIVAWVASSGCQLAYFMTDPDKEREVKAEYNSIGSRKVAVLVWADRSTLDVYPRARYRVGKAVAYHMKKYLPKARFVAAEEVARLQDRSGTDWEGMTVGQLCKRLDCDLVLRVDLLEYTTRASDTVELRKGRVRATVNLYEPEQGEGDYAAYQTDVTASFPPDSLHGTSEKDEGTILHETVELFGQAVARKFYDHGESLRGPSNR